MKPDNLHLTVDFLGSVALENQSEVLAAPDQNITPGFALTLEQFGSVFLESFPASNLSPTGERSAYP